MSLSSKHGFFFAREESSSTPGVSRTARVSGGSCVKSATTRASDSRVSSLDIRVLGVVFSVEREERKYKRKARKSPSRVRFLLRVKPVSRGDELENFDREFSPGKNEERAKDVKAREPGSFCAHKNTKRSHTKKVSTFVHTPPPPPLKKRTLLLHYSVVAHTPRVFELWWWVEHLLVRQKAGRRSSSSS